MLYDIMILYNIEKAPLYDTTVIDTKFHELCYHITVLFHHCII